MQYVDTGGLVDITLFSADTDCLVNITLSGADTDCLVDTTLSGADTDCLVDITLPGRKFSIMLHAYTSAATRAIKKERQRHHEDGVFVALFYSIILLLSPSVVKPLRRIIKLSISSNV